MRKAPAFPKPLAAILAAMALLCTAFFGFAAPTPKGVQCPTAPVQRVVARDCCGKPIVRAPKLGEKSFVQCRCAEKKSAAVEITLAERMDFFLVAAAPLPATTAVRLPSAIPAFSADFRSIGFPPIVRPPTAS